MRYPLSKMKIGQTARIVWLSDDSDTSVCSPESKYTSIRCRLLDLGFEPGSLVTCMLKKNGDALSAYLIKGAVIALRREASDQVIVEEQEVVPGNVAEVIQ